MHERLYKKNLEQLAKFSVHEILELYSVNFDAWVFLMSFIQLLQEENCTRVSPTHSLKS